MIELIGVIVILGVLSALALPRFIDIRGEARATRMRALVGAFNTAIAMAHAQMALAGGGNSFTQADGSVITYAGLAPSASSASLLLTAQSMGGVGTLITNGDSSTDGRVTFCLPDSEDTCGTGSGFCSFRYTVNSALPDGFSISTTYLTTANCSR